MNYLRAIGDYRSFKDALLLTTAITTIEALTGNANFVTPSPDLATLTAAKDDYQTKLAKANQKGSPLDISLKNEAKEVLADLLQKLAFYVNSVANGNLPLLLSAGLPLTQPRLAGMLPSVPERLRLSDGRLSGELRWDVDSLGRQVFYEYCYASEKDAAGEWLWSDRQTTTSSRKNLISGLTAGLIYAVRVRGVNTQGPGDWCTPETLIVR